MDYVVGHFITISHLFRNLTYILDHYSEINQYGGKEKAIRVTKRIYIICAVNSITVL